MKERERERERKGRESARETETWIFPPWASQSVIVIYLYFVLPVRESTHLVAVEGCATAHKL